MQRLEVSGAVRHIYIYVVRRLKVNGLREVRLSASGLSSTSRTTGLPDIAGFWISEYYNNTPLVHSESDVWMASNNFSMDHSA